MQAGDGATLFRVGTLPLKLLVRVARPQRAVGVHGLHSFAEVVSHTHIHTYIHTHRHTHAHTYLSLLLQRAVGVHGLRTFVKHTFMKCRKVDMRLLGKGNSKSYGARPVYYNHLDD